MPTKGRSDSLPGKEHEGSPGMDAITIVYCILFFLGYLFFFFEIWNRWQSHL